MTVSIKQLADGQLPSSIGDLYTVPASTETVINTITYVNTHTSALEVNLYIKPSGGVARRIIPKNMSLGISYLMVYDDEENLDAGDKIQGDAGTASKVDYTISGIEKA